MRGEIAVARQDLVIVTLGSMTEASSLGSMDSAPVLKGKADGGAWTLWEKIAAGRPEFGRPSVFDDHIDESKWVSFTTTQHDPTFFRIVRDFTGNVAGEGGLITFLDSGWLLSIVLPHQPHFIGQPDDVNVFWGYGLSVDKPGDFVKKPMSACTGREIMTELLGHLRIEAEAARILETSICIPCMMPFITSQFLRRERGRSAAGRARGLDQPRLHRPVLRTPRRRRVHRRILGPLGPDGGLLAARARIASRRPSTRGITTRACCIGPSKCCTTSAIDRIIHVAVGRSQRRSGQQAPVSAVTRYGRGGQALHGRHGSLGAALR